jgi:4-hydroxy-tetrahydrodipicolinate synthase
MRLDCPEDFVLLSGDDPNALGYMAHGGHGCISVTCNVAPEIFAAFMNDCLSGRWAAALEKQDQLIRLHKALFLDASPAPTKFALAHLGLCTEEVRLPVTPCADAVRPAILAALHAAGADAEPGRRAIGAK